MAWRILSRHKWVAGATITESVSDDDRHRYTATVRGYRNWRLFEGVSTPGIPALIVRAVRAIRDQIDAEGEHAEAFTIVNQYCHDAGELARRTEQLEHPISEAFDAFLALDMMVP